MPVIANLHPALSVDELLRLQGRVAERPEVKGLAQWAIDEAQRLAAPAVVYEWFPVRAVDGGARDGRPQPLCRRPGASEVGPRQDHSHLFAAVA